MTKTKTKTKTKATAPQIAGLQNLFLATGRFEDAWTFWTEIAGGKGGETWEEEGRRSGIVEIAGQSIVLGGNVETNEDAELGHPVKHGMATLFFGTPDIEKLYEDLANRGASILRGPLKTHWGAKVMTVKAGDAVVAFVEVKKTGKRK